MKSFASSVSGRVFLAALALASLGTGGATLAGPGAHSLGTVSLVVGLGLMVAALASAVSEHFTAAAIAINLVPFLAFAARLGQDLLSPRVAAGATVVFGLAAAVVALMPPTRARASDPELAALPRS